MTCTSPALGVPYPALPRSIERPPAARGQHSARQSASSDVLCAIADPTINIVVWRRGESSALSAEALSYAAALTREPFEAALDEATLARLPAGAGRDELIDDWRRALATFRQLAGDEDVATRLGVVTTDRCRLFHADFNRLRWLCTYAGPGTQWVADEHVNREPFELGHIPPHRVNEQLVPDETCVQQAACGDVVILKGNDHANSDGKGAIHRSPPIAGLGIRRLVLTLTW